MDRSTSAATTRRRDGTAVKYYAALGVTLAMRQVPSGGGAGTLYYLFDDHLGTVVATTSLSGTLISSQKYWPYGGQRSGGIAQTDKLLTGQQQEPNDSALGLYDYKARFYSTTLGRFASVDPIGGDTDARAGTNAAPRDSSLALRLAGGAPRLTPCAQHDGAIAFGHD